MASNEQKITVLLAQYTQCYARLLHRDSRMWEMPSVITALTSGLVLVAFQYASDIAVRELILLIGAGLASCLLIAMVKHRLLGQIDSETISAIEGELVTLVGTKRVQTATFPK